MPDRARSNRRFGLAFAIVSTALLMVAASAPSPFYPRFAEELGLAPVATTLIFSVYAFTMLTALLVAGAVSDAVGRRPVVSAGSLLVAVSLLLFWQADGLAMLIVARALQGVAAGLLLPAVSAMVVDSASPLRPQSASLWNTIAGMIGLATGAITAAIVLDVAADPERVVFGSLAAAFVLIAAAVWAADEPVRSSRGRARLTVPRLFVPAHLRPALSAALPAIIASWATNGLFLALGSSVVAGVFGATSHAQQSSAIPVFAIAGVVTAVSLRQRSARFVSVYGTAALGIGTALSLGALALQSLPVYVAAVAVMGSGFGTTFMGVLKTLMPRVDPSQRAAVMAVIYAVSYLAFGVPTIIAGLLAPIISLAGAMITLGALIVLLCLIATVKRLRVRELASLAAEEHIEEHAQHK